MTWLRRRILGITLGLLAATGVAVAQAPAPMTDAPPASAPSTGTTPDAAPDAAPSPAPNASPAQPEGVPETNPAEESALGPTPLPAVNILNQLIYGDNYKDAPIKVYGWLDGDYTYRSTGPGRNNVAPVENRFGDEFLARELGLYVTKALSKTDWDWGFNAIFIAGSDAAFIAPTAGYYNQTNPRFGTNFTDLNLTAHLPILTEGGVDIKAGRQTTCLGPMGALSWQRPFDSSDYAWYNLEEGRYTGVSAIWHVNKQLDIYNGIEIGGWGVFFDNASHEVNYLGQINYWLDCDAKKTKVWTTVLVGPTGLNNGNGNTTVFEAGILHNYNQYVYQIIDTQMVHSKQPVFGSVPPGYQERAYDVYTYIGVHLDKCWDVTSRFEWYKDVDGGGYPGGFGVPHTDYFETTIGLNYHPVSWLEFRPEVRYDYATHDNFGPEYDKKNQLSIAADLLLKF